MDQNEIDRLGYGIAKLGGATCSEASFTKETNAIKAAINTLERGDTDAAIMQYLDIVPDISPFLREYHSGICIDKEAVVAAIHTNVIAADAKAELADKQATIDRLMLEYCPEEMTLEQIAEFERHQQAYIPAGAKLALTGQNFCYCNDSCSLQMISGGGSKEGLYGVVTLKIEGQYVSYVPAKAAPVSAEPVATLLGPDPYDERTGFYLSLEDRERLSKLPAGTRLFTEAQPAPDVQAAVAAALEKAAQICDKWSHYPGGAWKAQDEIRAIPRDSSALDTYVREKCLAVAKLRSDTDAMGYTDAAYQVSDEDLVDRVLAKG